MKIVAGVIGTGIGQKHLEAIENYKNSKVKIICELDKKKTLILKKRYPTKIITNNENFIFNDKDINLVSIASYDNYHYKQIIKGLNKNKNLIIEKPMCLNFKQLRKIYFLLNKKKNLKITSNLVLRVNSLFNYFKKATNNKNIYYIEADYIWGRKHKLFGWRSKVREYSVIYGAAIHMIDLIMWMTESKPIKVSAYGNDKATKNSKFKKNSLIVIMLEFPNNILVKITANASATYNHLHEIKIFSKNQTLVNNNSGSYKYENGKLKKINSNYPDKKNRKKMIQNFIDHLLDKSTNLLISHKEQFDLMSICFAAEKSINLEKKITIKYL